MKSRGWYSERVKQPGSVVLQQWIAQRKSAEISSRSFSTMDHELILKLFGGGTYTGRSVNDNFALAVSTVWRCVQLLSLTIGALPWAVYERVSPGKAREADDHPLADILIHSPNADMDRMQFKGAKAANLALRGNAYSLKELRRNGTVSSLYPMPTKQVTAERDRETGAMQYVYMDRGKREVYPSEKVWRVSGLSFDGLVGRSPLGDGRHAIALAAAAEEFGSRFFGQGGRASALLKIPQWLEDDQRKKAEANVRRLHGGLDNAHGVKLLEGGMEYEEISAKPNEAQHNELRGFQIPDICRFFGVPPHLAFDLQHGSYNNVETLASEFVTFGLLPLLSAFELSAQKQLLPPADRRRFFVRFNFEGLLRANSLERSQFYAGMLQNGILSRNEVREKENLDRVDDPGMDDRTVQTNLALIQFLEAMVKAGAETGRGDPAAGGGDKGTAVNVSMPAMTVTLPDSVRHDVKHSSIELNALIASIERLAQGQAGLQAQLVKIAAAAGMPRKPVYDAAGNLVGSVPVEKL